jgi:hypothetical protein
MLWLKPVTAKTMASTDAAWLAGFFDDEGSFGRYRGSRGYGNWILSIANTHIARR